jgi:hypothetical protein
MKLTILIPHGGLNGNINECLISIANQVNLQGYDLHVKVLFDSGLQTIDVAPYVRTIFTKRKIKLSLDFDVESTSIIDLRKKLIYSATTDLAVFLDSDAILMPDALSKLVQTYVESEQKVAFVEGMRIEVGGRAQEKDFNMELKQVSENNTVANLCCGDTCLLLIDVALFKSANWDKLYYYFDKRGMGGSDFALTIDVLASNENHIGLPQYAAQCWHVASPSKGYWKNYTASDQLIETTFFSDYTSDRAVQLKSQLFGKL